MSLSEWFLQPALKLLRQILRVMEMNNDQLLERLEALDANIGKIGGETSALVDEVQDLKDALAAAGGTSPEVDAALAAIEARVKAVDDLVQDPEDPEDPEVPEAPDA